MEAFVLKIVTPHRVLYEKPVERIIFRTTEGEMAVLKGHIPLTAVIDSTVFRITEEEGTERKLAVHEGFIEILGDRVSLLAESAEWPDEIDQERAERAKKRAEERLSNKKADLDIRRAELSLRRALIRLETIR